MKMLDIRFRKESGKKMQEQQIAMIALLEQRLPERIAEKFDDVTLRVRLSGESGYSLSGFRDKDEREKFLEFLEELWNDDSLMME